MHEYRKAAREGAASKLKSFEAGEPHKKVDSSSWSPPAMEEANVQTGMRPVSPRQYKSGGKVHGEHSKKRADRKARKAGGEVMPPVDRLINRDMKKANALRDGVKHIGGMKKGGKVKREHHADGYPAGSADDIAKIIRQAEIEQNMKGRGIPARVPLPPRRPVEPDHYIPDTTLTTQGAKKGGKIRSKHAKGGAAHPDEAEDKALIRKMVKPEARTGKAHGGEKWIQGAIKHKGSLHRALHVPEGEKIPASKLKKAEHSKNPKLAKKAHLAETLKRMHHADGGEAGRGLYVRQNYPHEVPGADGGRTAKKRGGAIGKGKTNVNIMIHPHSPMGAMGAPAGMPPMGGPMMPPPPPPRPPMPPMGAMGAGAPMPPPMGAVGAGMPPMGAARPGMPPIGRKSGGKVEHVIDHAAGGGLGRLEKIKAYGLE
jgi:hypothetical protein